LLQNFLVTTIKPGVGTSQSDDVSINQKKNVTTQDTLMDLVRNLFPENIIQVWNWVFWGVSSIVCGNQGLKVA